MAATRKLTELVQERVARDPEFALVFLREGVDAIPSGELEGHKSLVCDYIKTATDAKAAI